MSKTSKQQIDRDEKKIMAELEKNANENLDTLAKRVKFSRQKIWRIIKKLENTKHIWGYTAVIDDEKRFLEHYLLLLKRSIQSIDEKTLNNLMPGHVQELATKIEASVESISYIQGDYDWIITFTAPDIIHAKKFSEMILTAYPGMFERLSLMETLVPLMKQHIPNPNLKKLRDFF